MFRLSLLFTLLITSIQFATSTPAVTLFKGRGFSLSRPVTVVSSREDLAAQQRIIEIIAAQGVVAGGSFSTKTNKAKIQLERVRVIDNITERDAFKIKVTSKKVTILYTSDQALDRAIDHFATLATSKMIPAQDIVHSDKGKIKRSTINAARKLMSSSEIESMLRNNREREIYLQMVDADNWRLECNAFKLINPDSNPYPTNGHYKYSQILTLINKVNNHRFTLVPTIDLITPNSVFERVTGHSQFSVEGMRFVRAIIEECVEQLDCKKIAVGMKTENTDPRYIDFLETVGKLCSVEIVFN